MDRWHQVTTVQMQCLPAVNVACQIHPPGEGTRQRLPSVFQWPRSDMCDPSCPHQTSSHQVLEWGTSPVQGGQRQQQCGGHSYHSVNAIWMYSLNQYIEHSTRCKHQNSIHSYIPTAVGSVVMYVVTYKTMAVEWFLLKFTTHSSSHIHLNIWHCITFTQQHYKHSTPNHTESHLHWQYILNALLEISQKSVCYCDVATPALVEHSHSIKHTIKGDKVYIINSS